MVFHATSQDKKRIKSGRMHIYTPRSSLIRHGTKSTPELTREPRWHQSSTVNAMLRRSALLEYLIEPTWCCHSNWSFGNHIFCNKFRTTGSLTDILIDCTVGCDLMRLSHKSAAHSELSPNPLDQIDKKHRISAQALSRSRYSAVPSKRMWSDNLT